MAIQVEAQNPTNMEAFLQAVTDPWWNLIGAETTAYKQYVNAAVNATYDSVIEK